MASSVPTPESGSPTGDTAHLPTSEGIIPAFPEASRHTREAYQPLSGLSVVGFTISALFTGVLGVCVLYYFIAGTPVFWSLYTLVVPIVGLIVSAFAFLLIQRSEGTRAGLPLARWGILLGALVPALYIAYYSATYFVIRQQSTAFLEEWVQLIRNGEVHQAFQYTLSTEKRDLVDANLKNTLIAKYDNPGGPGESYGSLTSFLRNSLVRLIWQGSSEAKLEVLGVRELDYVANSYKVQLNCRAHSPELSGLFLVTLMRAGVRHKGQRWHIKWDETGPLTNHGVSLTELGNNVHNNLHRSVALYMGNWINYLGENKTYVDAYLATLPIQNRPKNKAEVEASKEYKDFLAGSLVHVAPKGKFMPEKEDAEKVKAEVVRLLFEATGGQKRYQIVLEDPLEPWQLVEDKIIVRRPVRLGTPIPRLFTIATLEGNAKLLEGADPEWRLVKLEVERRLPEARADGPGGRR